MSRISTYWDYGLKKECFKVIGDVGYTKTTDIVLTPIGEIDTSRIEYGTQKFSVDVVGDSGASNVIIYDNDLPISVFIDGEENSMISWNRDMNVLEFTVRLLYDVEHNIRARYLGNNKCLASKSRLITLTEPVPDAYSTTLRRYNDSVVDYTPNQTFTLPIEFVSGKTLVTSEDKVVDVYIDDTLLQSATITIPSQSTTGTTVISVQDGLSIGKHTIKLDFKGDEHNSATSYEFQISMGYIVTVIDYDKYSINNSPVDIDVRVTNYLGNGISNKYINGRSSARTDSQGYATIDFNEEMMELKPEIWTHRLYITSGQIVYESEEITIRKYSNVTVSTSADTLLVGEGKQSTITARVNNVNISVPVTLTGGGLDGVYNTTTDGLLVKQYNGNGAGNVTINANVYNSNSSITIEDVLQYWDSNGNSINKEYEGIVEELSNGFKMSGTQLILPYKTDSWELSFKVVSAAHRVGNVDYNYTYGLFGFLKDNYISATQLENIKANDVLKFTYDGTKVKYQKNNEAEQILTTIVNVERAKIVCGNVKTAPNVQSTHLTINNLKWKRL